MSYSLTSNALHLMQVLVEFIITAEVICNDTVPAFDFISTDCFELIYCSL